MAKTKKKIILTPPKHIYYAYFNPETEKFHSSSNVLDLSLTHYAKITEDDHRDICSGKLKLIDCILDKQVDFDGSIIYKLLTPQMYNEFNFQNTLLMWVSDSPNSDTNFVIEWNKLDRQWMFYVTDEGRKLLDGGMYDSTLIFFVMLETDFDFLIRTFYIKLHDILKLGRLGFDFESKMEDNIHALSISTRRFFNSYGLKIND
jgi:hypothetical protein